MQTSDVAPYIVVFTDFPENISVTLKITQVNAGLNIRFSTKNNTDKIIEHIEVLPLILKPFVKNGEAVTPEKIENGKAYVSVVMGATIVEVR